jgi:hypothetical protein
MGKKNRKTTPRVSHIGLIKRFEQDTGKSAYQDKDIYIDWLVEKLIRNHNRGVWKCCHKNKPTRDDVGRPMMVFDKKKRLHFGCFSSWTDFNLMGKYVDENGEIIYGALYYFFIPQPPVLETIGCNKRKWWQFF